jgi:micrococcal nuclease
MLTFQFQAQQAARMEYMQQMQRQAIIQRQAMMQRQLESQQPPQVQPIHVAVVKRVVDGDTIELTSGHKVRISGIDAPESDQDGGTASTEELERLVDGKRVFISIVVPADKYGRTVAKVFTSGRDDVGLKQVENGMAWHDEKYAPDDLELANAQSNAKLDARGLWQFPNPIPPAEFRDQKSPSSVQPIDASALIQSLTESPLTIGPQP